MCYLGLLRTTGRWDDLVAADPLDEEAHLRLVQQYVDDGDRGPALRQLDSMDGCGASSSASSPARRPARCARRGPGDAGGRPGARLVPAGRRHARPASPDQDRRARPGRVARAGAARLARLVTLLGIGGVGKTRLAAEVAHRYAEATSPACVLRRPHQGVGPGPRRRATVRELGIRCGGEPERRGRRWRRRCTGSPC